MKKTTMMTSDDAIERSAALAARVHRLSDPLAAMGQRSPSMRMKQERNARVALLVLTLTATFAITGAIAALTDPGDGTSSRGASQVVLTDDAPADIRSGAS